MTAYNSVDVEVTLRIHVHVGYLACCRTMLTCVTCTADVTSYSVSSSSSSSTWTRGVITSTCCPVDVTWTSHWHIIHRGVAYMHTTADYLRHGGCFRRCLSFSNFAQKLPLHKIFREGWQWANEQTIKFRWRSGSPSGYRIVFRIRHYWEIQKVVNAHKSAAHTVSLDGGTGKTCFGEGIHCPSASSWQLNCRRDIARRSVFTARRICNAFVSHGICYGPVSVCLCVRLSVCLSITNLYSMKTAKHVTNTTWEPGDSS